MNTPLISIIIPIYNRENLVKETLNSVLDQTYENWECIIVDDGSTDKSVKILNNFATKDKRFKVFQRTSVPKGAPACRNIGMGMVSGEYLIFLDSDDLIAPWCLEKRCEHFYKQPKLDLLVSNGLQFNSKSEEFYNYSSLYGTRNILRTFLNLQVVYQTTSPTWKAAFLKKHEIKWNVTSAPWDDVDFSIKALSFHPNYEWNDVLPDYFLRSEDDPNALTSKDNILNKVEGNFYTYENWLTNEKNRLILEKSFPNYLLSKLEFLLDKKELKNMLDNHSDLIKKHLGIRSVYYLKLYNSTRNIKFIKGIVFRARPYLTSIKRKKVEQRKYQFNEKVRDELLNKLNEFDSCLFKNYKILNRT